MEVEVPQQNAKQMGCPLTRIVVAHVEEGKMVYKKFTFCFMLLIYFIFHLAVNPEGSRLEEIPRPPSYTPNGYFPTNELTYSNLGEFGAHPGNNCQEPNLTGSYSQFPGRYILCPRSPIENESQHLTYDPYSCGTVGLTEQIDEQNNIETQSVEPEEDSVLSLPESDRPHTQLKELAPFRPPSSTQAETVTGAGGTEQWSFRNHDTATQIDYGENDNWDEQSSQSTSSFSNAEIPQESQESETSMTGSQQHTILPRGISQHSIPEEESHHHEIPPVESHEESSALLELQPPSSEPVESQQQPFVPHMPQQAPTGLMGSQQRPITPLGSQQLSNDSGSSQQQSTTPVGSQQRPTAPIGFQQRPIAPIGSQQRPRAPVGYQQRSSAPFGPQQRPRAPVGSQQRLSAPLDCQQRFNVPGSSQQRPRAPVSYQQRPSAPIGSQQRPSAPVGSQQRPSAPVVSQQRPITPLGFQQTQSVSSVLSQQHSNVSRAYN